MGFWGRFVGLVTATVLVAGLAVMPGSDAVAAEAATTTPEIDADAPLSVVESTAAESVVPVVPEGDFSLDRLPTAIDLPARSFTRPNLIDLDKVDLDDREVINRDRFSTAYEGPRGTSIVVLGETPQNVEVDGKWVATDDALSRSDSGWQADLHPLTP